HVKPIYNHKEIFKGYEHISEEHREGDMWIWDLINKRKKKNKGRKVINRELLLNTGEDRRQLFDMDCCFLCETIFWADIAGIPINEDMLSLLKQNRMLFSKKDQIT